MGHAQQRQDVQVLARLGHRPLVARDHDERHVHAARAGKHVFDEPLVAGHVHDARVDRRRAGRPRRQIQVGKAQINRHAARLFLVQPVGIRARERANQRGLAVVHVAGRADDHVPRRRSVC
jgi:hypothetical protein